MGHVPDTATTPIAVQLRPAVLLAEGLLRGNTARCSAKKRVHLLVAGTADVPVFKGIPQAGTVYGRHFPVNQPGPVQLAENGHHAAGTMDILHVVFLGRRCHLAEIGHPAGETVDIRHGEGNPCLLRGRQQMQNGVGRSPHGDVQGHCVLERLEGGDGTGQHRGIVLLVVALGQLHDEPARLEKQLLAIPVSGQQAAIARQSEPKGFRETVHGVGGEHAGTGTAGGTSGALYLVHRLVALFGIGGGHHGIHQIQVQLLAIDHHLARLHRPAGDEHRGDVETQRGVEHPRRDLVAVGDTDQCVGTVGVDHVLHRVGDQLPRWERIEHPPMSHGDTIVDGDGIELLGHTARLFDAVSHQLTEILQVDMAGDELRERVGHRDDGLLEVVVLHSRGPPQGAGARHVAAMGGGS